jgi:hypothetical protein
MDNFEQYQTSIADAAARSASGKPYLGDSKVVGAYVRGFLARIADRVAQVAEGKLDRAAASGEDRKECGYGADVFLGKDDAYESQGQWNTSGGGLVHWIYSALPMYEMADSDAESDGMVVEVFGICALLAYEAISFHAAHKYGDEALYDDLDNLADSFATFLLGVPGAFEQQAATILSQ